MEHLLVKQIKSLYYKPKNVIITWYVVTITCYMQLFGTYAANIPALLVFGDSIVDSGNNDYIPTIGRANFPPYGRDFYGGQATGRYSNGKIPSDLIAEAMGIKDLIPPYLDPQLSIKELATGVTFAFGASGYDPDSSKLANVKTLDEQLNYFKDYIKRLKAGLGENRTSEIISQSVYIICAGSNDITNTYFGLSLKRLNFNVSAYSTKMVTWASAFVQELYGLGARRIGVISAPPCGCLPSQRTLHGGLFRHCADKENSFSVMYNNKLISELSSLNQKLSGSRVVYLDIFNPVMNIIANSAQSGFTVIDRGCCGTGNLEVSFLCTKLDIGTCKDASKYMFWDSFHPSEATYRIIVNDLIQKNTNLFF